MRLRWLLGEIKPTGGKQGGQPRGAEAEARVRTALRPMGQPMLYRMWERLQGLVNAQSPLLLLQQDRAQVLELLIKAAFSRRMDKLKRPRRSLLITGFVHPCIERINLARFMLSSAVSSMVPTAVWDEVGKPMEAFKYSVAPYLAIANFSNVAVNAAALRGRQCKCHEPWAEPFRNPATGHVTTKDLRLAARYDERLAVLMAKGT